MSQLSNVYRQAGVAAYGNYRKKDVEPKTNDTKTSDATKTQAATESGSATITRAQNTKIADDLIPSPLTWKMGGKTYDVGHVIGSPKLSQAGLEYYEELKQKFGNMDFILVSSDKKAAVQANAARYGNPQKTVVLIDDEKIERMATDPEYRKKYEAIIASSRDKLTQMKSDLQSTGASFMNFGMNVDSDGNSSFFATVANANINSQKQLNEKAAQKKAERKNAEKKAHIKSEKKLKERRAKEKALEEKHKAEKAKEIAEEKKASDPTIESDDDYEITTFRSDSIEAIVRSLQDYALASRSSIPTEAEAARGTQIDFQA